MFEEKSTEKATHGYFLAHCVCMPTTTSAFLAGCFALSRASRCPAFCGPMGGRLKQKGRPIKHQRSPSSGCELEDLERSLTTLDLRDVTNTPRRSVRTPKAKPKPASARKGGLDGEAWQRVEVADASPELIAATEEDDGWLVHDAYNSSDEADDLSGDGVDATTSPRDLSAPTPVREARSFAKRRDEALLELFTELNHGLADGLLSDVECAWSRRLRTTAGRTLMHKVRDNYGRGDCSSNKCFRTASIEISTHVVDSYYKLESTLAHELCHAAAWIIDGVAKPPHGRVFKAWAARVHAAFPHITVATTHQYFIAYKFRWRCSNTSSCTYAIGRHSQSIDLKKHICPRCAAPLIEDHRALLDLPRPSSRRIEHINA